MIKSYFKSYYKIQIMAQSLALLLTVAVAICLLVAPATSYTTQITMDTASAKTVTNFNTDLGSCSCDISTACDTFCCCDTKCSTEAVTGWTNSGWCAGGAVEVQKFCDRIGSKGFSTFQDLGCIMYSNRGAIGQFYATPDANNVIDPNIAKFSIHNTNAQGTPQYIIPTSTTYQQNSALRFKTNPATTAKSLLIWVPSMGSSCRQSYVPIKETSTTTTCFYQISDSETCLNANINLVDANYLFCRQYSCTNTVTPSAGSINVAAASYDSVAKTCTGVVTGVEVDIVIDYTSGQYRVVSGKLVFIDSAAVSGKVAFTTKINIQKTGTSSSGNPGYIIGKPLKFSSSGGIYRIANPTDSSCLTTPDSTLLDIKFGVNQTFHCLTTDPCSASLYIDQLSLANTYKLSKYASKSTEEVSVAGLSQTACAAQQFTLNILYSYSGWILDPQYYILGSTITSQNSVNNLIKMKKINVKWVRIEPDAVFTPPINYFYQYFQMLWLPLKGAFYKYVAKI